ncbi:FHA domain-containing protein [bacterium]|nr:FHA domain-containing protein [bacterium]
MNICPNCESEMDHGLELCENCTGEGIERVMDEAIEKKTDGPFACLELEDGQRFDLSSEETLLGRSDPLDQIEPDVDLSYCGGFEQGVSRRHAIIMSDEDGYVLEDLGSTNGTVVNREKVIPGSPVNLVEGDVIHLGKMKAIFHAGAAQGSVS